MKPRPLVWYWMPVITWMLVIFAASTDMMSAEHTSRIIAPFLRWLTPDISVEAIVRVQILVRKAAHVTEYAILGALLLRAFGRGNRSRFLAYATAAWMMAIGWAALDEFHQSFVASRTGSPIDVMIDATGAFVGLALYALIARRSGPAAAVAPAA